jgi:chemotaxis protein methyltransferase CheR
MNGVSPEEFKLWANYIKSICGINLDSTKNYLIENRLSSLAQETGSKTWSELYAKVKVDVGGVLRRKIINAITTGETSFFRDTSPFELLAYKVLPELIDNRKKQYGVNSVIPLRIWSAASSTGQEVYSIAITIKELLGDLKNYDIRILGTDISDKVIAQASYGKYSKLEIERGMPVARLERYFTRDGDGWKISDPIRAMVTFKSINLLEYFSFPYKFDIVFCRNVAIYFADEDRKKLFERIGSVLAPDGSLVIGSTESITTLCPQYEPKRHMRSVYYQLKRN